VPLATQTQDLLRMERILLDSLSWRVKMPTAYTFLHLYTQSTAAVRSAGGVQACQATSAAAAGVSAAAPVRTSDPLSGAVVAKAAYLIELALLDYGMLEFRPSMVAAAALLLSHKWSPQGASVDEVQAISGAKRLCSVTGQLSSAFASWLSCVVLSLIPALFLCQSCINPRMRVCAAVLH
jgi:hypothetical protein